MAGRHITQASLEATLIILVIRNWVSGVLVTIVSACLWVGGQIERERLLYLYRQCSRIKEDYVLE